MHKAVRTAATDLAPQELAILRVVDFIVRGDATSRAEIARRTGLARSTVSQQVDHLLKLGLVEEVPVETNLRGRPPRTLSVAATAGCVAVADVDTQQTNLALADLSGRIMRTTVVALPVDRGPEVILREVEAGIRRLLAEDVNIPLRQIVVGVPGPVDFRRGRAVRPPIMPGWDGYPIADSLRHAFGAPVVVDNDVNLAALAEAAQDYAATPLLVIKVASGIGAGIVTATGEIHRGADGAAGDIGHIRTAGNDHVPCRCGKTGCLEAVASFAAVAQALNIQSAADDLRAAAEELRTRITGGDAEGLRTIHRAAEEVGEVAAALIQMYNPRTLVISGMLGVADDEMLSGVRGVVYQRAVPLTTRELTLTTSQLGPDAGLLGGVELGLKEVWGPEGAPRLLGFTSHA